MLWAAQSSQASICLPRDLVVTSLHKTMQGKPATAGEIEALLKKLQGVAEIIGAR